jgi:hypothetical protein
MVGPSRTPPDTDDRDARLAAALRENLKRRKAQARSQTSTPQEKDKPSTPESLEEKTGG